MSFENPSNLARQEPQPARPAPKDFIDAEFYEVKEGAETSHRQLPPHTMPQSSKNVPPKAPQSVDSSSMVGSLNRMAGKKAAEVHDESTPDTLVSSMVENLNRVAGKKTPEAKPGSVAGTPSGVSAEMVEHLRAVNQDSLVNKVFEKLGVRAAVSKLEFIYNGARLRRNEIAAVQTKGKLVDINLRLDSLHASEQELRSRIDHPTLDSTYDSKALEAQLAHVREQRAALLKERDERESVLHSLNDEIRERSTKREEAAKEILKPIQEELAGLQKTKKEVEATIATKEARLKIRIDKLNAIEAQKVHYEGELKKRGMSERGIKKAVKDLEKTLADGREYVKAEQKYLAEKRLIIDGKIARVEEKGSKYNKALGVEPLVIAIEDRLKAAPVSALIAEWNTFLKERKDKPIADRLVLDESVFLSSVGLPKDKVLDAREFNTIILQYVKGKQVPIDLNIYEFLKWREEKAE